MYHFRTGCCDVILVKYTFIVSPLLFPLLFCAITREKRKRDTWYSVAVLVNNENIRRLYCKQFYPPINVLIDVCTGHVCLKYRLFSRKGKAL